jgi:hypothetical protein
MATKAGGIHLLAAFNLHLEMAKADDESGAETAQEMEDLLDALDQLAWLGRECAAKYSDAHLLAAGLPDQPIRKTLRDVHAKGLELPTLTPILDRCLHFKIL